MMRIAGIRLGICADRMRGCNETPQKHEMIEEVDAWKEEVEALLTAPATSAPEPKAGE